MRNKYPNEFEDFVRNNISRYTQKDFISLVEKEFNIKMTKSALKNYIRRHNIEGKYKDFRKSMSRTNEIYPVGTERNTKDGIIIKVAQPNVWRKKSRVMYEKYHNCKLKNGDYILFLNQDRTDFSKENLFKSSNREQCYLHNWGTFSKNPELTKTGILSARLTIKAKEVENVI